MSSRGQILAMFRETLRQVNQQLTKPNGNKMWREEVVRAYRRNISATTQDVAQLRADAENYLTYLRSFGKHRELIKLYNSSLISPEERLARTAHRVGLELPGTYEESHDAESSAADDGSSSSPSSSSSASSTASSAESSSGGLSSPSAAAAFDRSSN